MRQYELLLAPIAAWLMAQGIKFVISLRKDGLQFQDLYVSGGFPSSHTAFVISVSSLIGLRGGFDQPLFAAMATVSALVIYDAVGVRRSSGEQAVAIKELADKAGKKLVSRMHGAKGHTPIEVLGGLAVGFVIALVFYLLV